MQQSSSPTITIIPTPDDEPLTPARPAAYSRAMQEAAVEFQRQMSSAGYRRGRPKGSKNRTDV